VIIAGSVVVVALTAAMLGWNRFVPTLGLWEHFTFYYGFGAVDPYLSFVIAPRANIGGQGYPMLDLGIRLTQFLGLSFGGFRAITILYALIAYGAMIVVFARWFGIWSAVAGVTITVFSTGYLFFANQVLVMMPSLLLCVLLVERCQRLAQIPEAAGPKIAIAFLIALLLIHYGMGRHFAVGWILFFVGLRLTAGWRRLPAGPARVTHSIDQLGMLGKIVLLSTLFLCLLDFHNAIILLDPWNIFFPSHGVEVEMASGNILPTVAGNLPLIAEMLIPFMKISGGGHTEGLLTGKRIPLLGYWHAPFLIIGVGVALRRTFRAKTHYDLPYLALHVICALTIGLTVFSARFGDNASISSYRLNGGYFAIAGYITVASLWISETLLPRFSRAGHWMAAGLVLICAGAATTLTFQAADLRSRFDAKAGINSDTGTFMPVPEVMPYDTEANDFLQARYRKMAGLLAPALACTTDRRTMLLRISPRLLLNRGVYDGPFYIQQFNDLSTLMALYLGDRGVNAGYVIVHSVRAKGYKDRGHGYGGRPRVFSGPISWQDGEITYRAEPPLAYDLRFTHPNKMPQVIVAFSEAEAAGARTLLARQGRPLLELAPINSLGSLLTGNRTSDALCRSAD